MTESRRRDAWTLAIAAAVVAGAAIRFLTLSVQSFWLDEAVTHGLVTRSFGSMLSAIPHSESTPPLYYVLAWVWVRVFGADAAGLRSLSALFGTATVLVLALIARRLAGNRGALAAAALAATSPLLIWYSQEARAYGLLVLLCAVTVWCLLREDWRGWAIAAALALATHYFAVFIVVPEVAWLVVRKRDTRAVRWALAGVGVIAIALSPLAIEQAGQNRARFITAQGLGHRIVAVPKQFLIGYATPHATILTVLTAILAVGLALFVRRRDGGLIALAAIAAGVPVVLAVFGADYVITRNLIAAMVPLVVLAAVASTRTRSGAWLVAGLCAIGVIAFAGVEGNAVYQRDDWRDVAKALGAPTALPRVVVINPSDGVPPLGIYMRLRRIPDTIKAYTSREIDVVDLTHNPPVPNPIAIADYSACRPPQVTSVFVIVRYCETAARPPLPYPNYENLTLAGRPPSILAAP
ncbi:MAG TPA: glycosyltransferase family 39 protein [Solirubrobacteraceae bacterium]|jgi:uncharacterized membrane protein|nr:glycosyltransferase family 39 protein [Solirubrobacteraceae bacterium]